MELVSEEKSYSALKFQENDVIVALEKYFYVLVHFGWFCPKSGL